MKNTIAALGLVFVFCVSPTLAEIYRHGPTGIELPDSLVGYERGKIIPYGDGTAEPGVAVAFHGSDAEVTIYLRKTIPGTKKTAATFLSESLEAMRMLPQYSDVKIMRWVDDPNRTRWKSAAISAQMEQQPIHSFVSCAMRSGHLLKIRATTRNLENKPLIVFLKTIRDTIDSSEEP